MKILLASYPPIPVDSGVSEFAVLSPSEQLAAFLRGEIQRGRWSGPMPGGNRLAAEFGVGRDTAEVALQLLEKEGVLENRGGKRGRRIFDHAVALAERSLRVAFLLHEATDRREDFVIESEHRLIEAGHTVSFAPKTMNVLRMDLGRIAAMVEKTQTDAWIVLAGSREVLEWFAGRKLPVLAVFGRRESLPIAGIGPDKVSAIHEATKTLLDLGHRRMVFLTRTVNRTPEPSAVARAFLDELAANGIAPGPYHLPHWEESVKGLDARLGSLFRVSPPTAMIIGEAPFFVATRHFLGRMGLAVPGDVSLVCTDDDPAFAWCTPMVTHIRWDRAVVARRVALWASHVSSSRKDLRQSSARAVFVKGGTVGPVKGR